MQRLWKGNLNGTYCKMQKMQEDKNNGIFIGFDNLYKLRKKNQRS